MTESNLLASIQCDLKENQVFPSPRTISRERCSCVLQAIDWADFPLNFTKFSSKQSNKCDKNAKKKEKKKRHEMIAVLFTAIRKDLNLGAVKIYIQNKECIYPSKKDAV